MRGLGLPRPEGMPETVHPGVITTLTHRMKFDGSESLAYINFGLSEPDRKVYGVGFSIAQDRTFPHSLCIGISDVVSLALHRGMPLERLVSEWKGSRFNPHGLTANPDIPYADSIVDYAARYMERKFL
jgi:ribonucleoside-diphosphate reductase alpha chain